MSYLKSFKFTRNIILSIALGFLIICILTIAIASNFNSKTNQKSKPTVAGETDTNNSKINAQKELQKQLADKQNQSSAQSSQVEVGSSQASISTTTNPTPTTNQAPATQGSTNSTTTASQPIAVSNCHPSYPTICLPLVKGLNCPDIPYKNFTVLSPDPYRLDGDKDGIGCEKK